MKMAQTEASRIYQIEAITTPKNVTAHLNDLGLRVGVDILMVQKTVKAASSCIGTTGSHWMPASWSRLTCPKDNSRRF